MSTFTVKSTMPTGKANEKFGKEFYVQFDETEQAFPLWFKEAPEVGKQIEGEITNGKFKKIRKEWKPQDDAGGSSPSGGSQPRTPYKDNSDGMRQGMCFNNAANFVNTLVFEKTLTDREWADLTFAYAQALYRKGDLNVAPEGSQETAEPDPVATVKEVFGGGTKLVTPRGN